MMDGLHGARAIAFTTSCSARLSRIILCSATGPLFLMPGLALAQGVTLGDIDPPPQNPMVDENGVDIVDGTVAHEKLELAIGGNGIGALALTRYYSGSGGFRTNFDNEFLEGSVVDFPIYDHYASVVFGNSSEYFDFGLPKTATGSSYETMDHTLGQYIYRRKDGSYISFTNLSYYHPVNGGFTTRSFADFVQYPNGVRWTYHYKDLQYSHNGILTKIHRVQSITSNTGYQMKYYYASNNNPTDTSSLQAWFKAIRVVAINNSYEYCDPTANSCATALSWADVQYSASPGYFLTVTDSTGAQTDYTNNGSVRLPGSMSNNRSYTVQPMNVPCVIQSIPTLCVRSKVTSANIDGKLTNYSYTSTSTTSTSGPEVNSYKYSFILEYKNNQPSNYIFSPVTEYTDPLNRKSFYEYQLTGSGTNTYYGKLTKVTRPEGNYFLYTRDGSGNVTQTLLGAKAGSGAADITESRVIGTFAQPASITDPRNNVTAYTYDATHGGVLTETGPAAGGVAPKKRYAYAQRHAWIKNAAGSYVQATLPVWVRTEERTCNVTATVGNTCAGGAADEVIVTYDYGPNSGPNNLQVRGKVVTANGVSLRTCYGYDRHGNKVSETSPRAGLTTCP